MNAATLSAFADDVSAIGNEFDINYSREGTVLSCGSVRLFDNIVEEKSASLLTLFPRTETVATKNLPRELLPTKVESFHAAPAFRQRFKSLQGWEGVVESLDSEKFTARLFDKVDRNNEEMADFALADVFEEDLRLIQVGAVFYFDIGYLDSPGGRRRAAEIRFRRLPSWTERELEIARRKVTEFEDLFESTCPNEAAQAQER